MTDRVADSTAFEEIIRELLDRGLGVRFQARGSSMYPAICDGDTVEIAPASGEVRKNDIVLTKSSFGFRLHRIVRIDRQKLQFTTRGDSGQQEDPPLSRQQLLGVAEAKEVLVGKSIRRARFRGASGLIWRTLARGQEFMGRIVSRVVTGQWDGITNALD